MHLLGFDFCAQQLILLNLLYHLQRNNTRYNTYLISNSVTLFCFLGVIYALK